MKKWICLTLTAAFLLCLCACGGNKAKVITQEQAQAIALEDAGVTADQVDNIHLHTAVENGVPVYTVHFDQGGRTRSYTIHAGDGTILAKGNGGH